MSEFLDAVARGAGRAAGFALVVVPLWWLLGGPSLATTLEAASMAAQAAVAVLRRGEG